MQLSDGELSLGGVQSGQLVTRGAREDASTRARCERANVTPLVTAAGEKWECDRAQPLGGALISLGDRDASGRANRARWRITRYAEKRATFASSVNPR